MEFVRTYPFWLTRNCGIGGDIHKFRELFKLGFQYVAVVWKSARSRAAFEARYDLAVSDSHDVLKP